MRVSDESSYTYADLEKFLCKFLGIDTKNKLETYGRNKKNRNMSKKDDKKPIEDRTSPHSKHDAHGSQLANDSPDTRTNISNIMSREDPKVSYILNFEKLPDREKS